MEMTSQESTVTQGPLGGTSMPCGSSVNGIAAGLLIKHTLALTMLHTLICTQKCQCCYIQLHIHKDKPTQKTLDSHHH